MVKLSFLAMIQMHLDCQLTINIVLHLLTKHPRIAVEVFDAKVHTLFLPLTLNITVTAGYHWGKWTKI